MLLCCSGIVGSCTADPGERDVASPPVCAVGETDGELTVHNWPGYTAGGQLEAFAAAHDVTVTLYTGDSEQEMRATVERGGSGFDVIVASDRVVAAMIAARSLLPLTHPAIPNAVHLSADLVGRSHDPVNMYSLPYQWGTSGLMVNEEVLGEIYPRSWGLVFDPTLSVPYAGRIQLLDDPRETLGAALRYLGYSLNTVDETELDEARALVAAATDRLAAFANDEADELLASGETVIAHGYSNDLFVQSLETDNPDEFQYFVPREGGALWIDSFAIPFDAPHPCTAHAFIDWMYTPEQGASLSNWTYANTPNEAAIAGLDEELLEFVTDTDVLPGGVRSLEQIEGIGDFEADYADAFVAAKG